MRRKFLAAGFALALSSGSASAQIAYSDSLVQPPSLAPPQRGSLAGQNASFALGPADLVRGAFSLASPFVLPNERGAPGVNPFPRYSAEAGLSEWGLGWQPAVLSIQRWRVIGEFDYASPASTTDEFSSPWGRLVRGADGAWYPLGLQSLVHVAFDASSNVFTATAQDGTVDSPETVRTKVLAAAQA